ncbi:MAG: hypothetical protein HY888_13915 [Deltaproteobacteria bacterium]|nr:hypothetical protein [Deltaproteobacteria bacterium]
MQTKLTLSIESDVIEQAKEYARQQHRSLSNMVESYLKLIVRKDSSTEEITPIVASLSGILPMNVSDRGREEITAYLEEKYK